MSNAQGYVDALAATIKNLMSEKLGADLSAEDISKIIKEFCDNSGVSIVENKSANSDGKVAALLKPSPREEEHYKRMRELAGIPHRKNFI